MSRIAKTFFLLIFTVGMATSQINIINPREQAVWVDSMLEYRFEKMLPDMMKRTGIDMWVLISREYNEDPVMKTMLPSTWLSARRRTMIVFHLDKKSGLVEKIAMARYDVGRLMKGLWNVDVYPEQFEALAEYIQKKNPEKIGLNFSKDFGLADGLIYSEFESLKKHLPSDYHNRFVSAEKLSLAWLETRSPMELDFYKNLCTIGHTILEEVFSRKIISPNVTSTEDVVWALRKKVTDLGLTVWFHPTVSIQRKDLESQVRNFANRPEPSIIKEGDLLHVDFGFTYMRLNTDQQQHYYVLKNEEKIVPAYLQKAFKKTNRVQDILTSFFKAGVSGNDLLFSTLEQCKKENIDGTVYTHPIGFHGHAAGPTIGMWDMQKGVKGAGDYIVSPNTAYSIELNSASVIDEWDGKVIKIMLEEDGIYDGDKFYYPAGRQMEIKGI